MIYPAGEDAQQPISLRLCTFAALGWFNYPFIAQNPKNRPLFQNLIRCADCVIGGEMTSMLKNAPSQFAEAVAAGGPRGAVGDCTCGHPPQTNSSQTVVNMHPDQPSDN
jgi:hypothetical protein